MSWRRCWSEGVRLCWRQEEIEVLSMKNLKTTNHHVASTLLEKNPLYPAYATDAELKKWTDKAIDLAILADPNNMRCFTKLKPSTSKHVYLFVNEHISRFGKLPIAYLMWSLRYGISESTGGLWSNEENKCAGLACLCFFDPQKKVKNTSPDFNLEFSVREILSFSPDVVTTIYSICVDEGYGIGLFNKVFGPILESRFDISDAFDGDLEIILE